MNYLYGTYIFLVLITIIGCLQRSNSKNIINQIGGSRKSIFSRFHYTPDFNFISKFDQYDPNIYYKRYNQAQRLKFIMGRPYRNYAMKDGNWGYPWHFPEPEDAHCVQLASDRCREPIRLPSQGVLLLPTSKEVVKPSRCFDSVYNQCRQGVDPLYIQVKNIGIY